MAGGANPDINRVERAVWWGMLVVLGLAAVVRVAAVFTENVNRDEFGLLQRGATLARSGVLVGSGRPGLGTVLIAPFAEGCVNAVDAVVRARHLWTLFVGASIAAFGFLLGSVIPTGPMRARSVATGIGLWALAPPFLRYSVQVRTDQIALLGGLLGGALLLMSRRRPWIAGLAGASMSAGFLGSQKLVYVAGLAFVFIATWHGTRLDFDARREGLRIGLFALGFLGAFGIFRLLTESAGTPPLLPVEGQMSRFEYYRQTVGFSWYWLMVPALVGQMIALGQLLPATVGWFRGPRRNGMLLVAGWATLSGTVGIVAFHASRFPYFYMVLGLFPATVGALAVAWLLVWLQEARARLVLLASVWIPLAWSAALEARGMISDDLTHQRESLAFVEEAFPGTARGFGDRHEFLCRSDPDPFPLRSRIDIERHFWGEGGEARTAAFLQEFRERPVSFMIPSIEGLRYPDAVRDFWRTHYVTYFGHVAVPGRRLGGPPGTSAAFRPVVSGRYRWWPDEDGALRAGEAVLGPGEAVVLSDTSAVRLELADGGGGIFALEVDRPPRPDPSPFFTRYLERRPPEGSR